MKNIYQSLVTVATAYASILIATATIMFYEPSKEIKHEKTVMDPSSLEAIVVDPMSSIYRREEKRVS
jgi:hypothetical protein